jgi:hypothetical protein
VRNLVFLFLFPICFGTVVPHYKPETDEICVEYPSGDKYWYKNGKVHRDEFPAIELKNGTRKWYQYDKLHRDGDLPAVEKIDGTKIWYRYGQIHRDKDMPAIISGGVEIRYKFGEFISVK